MTLFELNELDNIETEPKTTVKTGELWQLGKHRLLCGDCSIKENVEKLMDGKKADMVFCFSNDTEIFTSNGWKLLKDCDINKDLFFSRNPETQELDFIKATHFIEKNHNGKMYYHKSKMVDLMVTPDHRIYYTKKGKYDFMKAEDFSKEEWSYFVSAGGIWKGKKYDCFKISGANYNALDFAYLLGIFITDGSVHKSGNIFISQKKEHIKLKIKEVLERLNINYSYYQCNHIFYLMKELQPFFKQFYLKKNRKIPQFIKDADTNILNKLLEGIIDGDGTRGKNKTEIYMGHYDNLINDITEIIYKCGLACRVDKVKGRKVFYKKENRYINGNDFYRIRIKKLSKIRHLKENGKWIDYNNKVYCVSLEKWHTVLVRRNGVAIWCGQCDPPYNIAYNEPYKVKRMNEVLGRKFKNKKMIKNDNIENIELFYYKVFSNMKDILNNYNSFYITCAGKNLFETLKALKDNDFIVNIINVWNKNNFVLSFNDYKGKHEFIVYGWQGKHKFYHKGKYQSSVWDIPKPMKSELHPTMKPIELIENAIKNSTLENHIVYDCFLGSGSTLIACEYTKRICYGIEIDERYCGIIIDRWEKMTRQKARRIA